MNKVEHRYGPGDVRLVTASFSTHCFEPHEHAEFAIAVISRGVEAVRYRGADEVAPAGSLLLLDAEVLHAGRPAVPEGWDYRVFYAPAALLAELGGRVPRFRSPTVQDPALARRLASVHRLLPRASELEAAERLAEAFTSLLTRYGGGRAPDRLDSGVARRIQRRLAEDLTSTPGLEELAEYAQMPRFQLLRAFRRETGTTPHRYLRQLRLRNAQQLLTAGYSVAQAAADSGFHDQAHMHRHFRRTFAATPGSFSRNGVQDRDGSPA